jgi:hypothetical protein
MPEFFPEIVGQITDPRKDQIAIRHLLQMRDGYPDGEEIPGYLENLFFREDWHWLPHIEGFPLIGDPET